MKVLVTMKKGPVRDGFISADNVKLLRENFDVVFNETREEMTEEGLSAALRDGYDAVLTGWGSPFIGDAGGLRLIAHTGGSVGDIVDERTYGSGVKVISANRIYAESTAEGVLAYILSALRNIPRETSLMRESYYWKEDGLLDSVGLIGKTVGVIGVGAVAKNLIRLLTPFRVKLLLYDDYEIDTRSLGPVEAEQTTLGRVLSESDVVTVHAALTDKTRGMIGKEEFSQIRDGALFVNASRGPIIDEQALIESLKAGRFRAFLDVYEREPLPAESELRRLPNVLLMPHRAGPANDLYPAIGREIILDMIRFRDGEELKYEIRRDDALRMTRNR